MPEQDTSELMTTFFKLVYGKNKGVACLAFKSTDNKFKERFYDYPSQLEDMVEAVLANLMGHNCYFCPNLLTKAERNATNILATPNAWANLDSCPPANLLVKPSIVLETSPRKFQAFWLFDRTVDPKDAQDISRRIALYHAQQGADETAWELGELYRIPKTYNYKYTDPTPVSIVNASKDSYSLDDFLDYPKLKGFTYVEEPMPNLDTLPDAAEIFATKEVVSPKVRDMFNSVPLRNQEWYPRLHNLIVAALNSDFTREEAFVVANEAKCNMYARDARPLNHLWKDVLRADAEYKATLSEVTTEVSLVDFEIMTDEERELVSGLPQTFVEEYIDWASGLSDAARQYHVAGAFIILSALLSGSVILPSSYGNIIPNLWFMILADTTLTRKSTAMDIATDILEDMGSDAILATDSTVEGLLGALQQRPRVPSIFLRDEVSGFFESILKKDYMAGSAEMFTKLYDGKMQKRILKRETIEIRNPRLLIFAGGIKDKVTSLLTTEHVSSGFIPRFIFITAESDVNKLKPLGPPTSVTSNRRTELINQLLGIQSHYDQRSGSSVTIGSNTINLTAMGADIPEVEARMSQEVWNRYNQLEMVMVEKGVESHDPNIFTPVGDRLSKSILKAAVLIAASRQKNEYVEVEITDLLRAIKYGETWLAYAYDVIEDVGKSGISKLRKNIIDFIRRGGVTGVTTAKIMRAFGLSHTEFKNQMETIEQMGYVSKSRNTRGATWIAL